MTKKILGLDLGVSSIGWALIGENENKTEILGMGCRIIPLQSDEKNEFSEGKSIGKNQLRTTKRTQRRGYDRYQQRRQALTKTLLTHDLFDANLFVLPQLQLWELRAKAATDRVELNELGRILYHLNQKRGYKSSRNDEQHDKKETEYVAEVKSRHELLKQSGQTIGQYFFQKLQENSFYRTKQQVFPRAAYIEEFDRIIATQKPNYPEVLTDELIAKLRNEIIYYQRKLKSQKGLVSICEFEAAETTNKEGKKIVIGPRVAPRSSPLAQYCKIWESIHTLSIKNRRGKDLKLNNEQKKIIFDHLNENPKLTSRQLFQLLNLKPEEGWYTTKQLERGIQGNMTRNMIAEILRNEPQRNDMLQFSLDLTTLPGETHLIDRKTGEVRRSLPAKVVSAAFEQQPLYRLWHTIYSISDLEECANTLSRNFNLPCEVAEKLAKLDFSKFGFAGKSAKAMRKIIPYLQEGFVYSDACMLAGYNHSNSLTKDQRMRKALLEEIPILPKNSLRQPVVEKVLNQTIHVVNALSKKFGRPDEIRIELARELKQSREERNTAFSNLKQREKENETISKRLEQEYHLRATRKNIIKYRLYQEISHDESKINATCIYCGKQFGLRDALAGDAVDVEHIIPKSLLFDDSQSNKTLSHRTCNEAKGNRTAFDYMSSLGETALSNYLEIVDQLFKRKIIGKAKRDKLLMTVDEIPTNFIDRQLRQTQYVARKAKEILELVCPSVWSTSGSVTEYLRRIWGWDDVLMNLRLPQARAQGKTKWVTWETENGRQQHRKEVILEWSKRDDHRHHAIDALVIACTKQGYIQRINNLSVSGNRQEMYNSVGNTKKGNLLESYLSAYKPFETRAVEQAASHILISIKAGKKVAVPGKRTVRKGKKKITVQKDLLIPRGPLSEEKVYGKINTIEKNKPIKYLFEHPDRIVKPRIRKLVDDRLRAYHNDPKKALASLKKEPIYLNNEKGIQLEYGSCYKEAFVIKYPIEQIKPADLPHIVDGRIRELVSERLTQYENKPKEAFSQPLFYDKEGKQPIRTVRMFTGLDALEPAQFDSIQQPVGFVKPGNNHHIALYRDGQGKLREHSCTFWHAVERKMHGLPVIIKDTAALWTKLLEELDKGAAIPRNFLEKLPEDNLSLVHSLQQNEMFILGMEPSELATALFEKDTALLSQHLYLVWSLSEGDYWFRHHLETKNTELKKTPGAKEARRFYRIKSLSTFEKLNPEKVRINLLGEVISTDAN